MSYQYLNVDGMRRTKASIKSSNMNTAQNSGRGANTMHTSFTRSGFASASGSRMPPKRF